jgi:hypothetical protein
LEQNLWKTLTWHCCICWIPANGRVNFEEWLAYKIQLHGNEWIVNLSADWDQSPKKKNNTFTNDFSKFWNFFTIFQKMCMFFFSIFWFSFNRFVIFCHFLLNSIFCSRVTENICLRTLTRVSALTWSTLTQTWTATRSRLFHRHPKLMSKVVSWNLKLVWMFAFQLHNLMRKAVSWKFRLRSFFLIQHRCGNGLIWSC